MVAPAPTPAPTPDDTRSVALRRWSVAALATNAGIVVTGGLVRVTGSGLGCPEWPRCQEDSVVPVPGAEAGWHQAIEFGNRLLTFVVLVAVVGALVAARRATPAASRARRWASLLVGGVLAQAVLGGITVRLDLHPGTVMAHFLLSMVLLVVATRLVMTARGTLAGRAAPTALRPTGAVLGVLAALVLVLGTVVTAAGPHAGDPGTPRLDLPITAVARTHSLTVWATVAVTVLLIVRARRLGDATVARAATVLLAVEVAQGGVGYWQYLTGVPARLVVLHMALATVFVVAVVRAVALATVAGRADAAVAETAPVPTSAGS